MFACLLLIAHSVQKYINIYICLMIVQSMRKSTKPVYIYIYIYIYIYTDVPDINMLTIFLFFCWLVVCILLNQIPATQMNPDEFLQTVFL